jgi:hypothetical protein
MAVLISYSEFSFLLKRTRFYADFLGPNRGKMFDVLLRVARSYGHMIFSVM